MARLLKRVRGDSPASAPSFAPAPPPRPVPSAAPAGPTPDDDVKATAEVAIEPVKPEEFIPRQKAPERTTNLAAMRELANSAARTAIVKHQKRSGHKKAMIQSFRAILMLVCGLATAAGAYYFHSLPGAIAAAVGLAAALFWGSKAALNLLRLMMLKAPLPIALSGKQTPASSESLTAESLTSESLSAESLAPEPAAEEPPADPTDTLHPDYIAPELSRPASTSVS
jgi:hypothetical protein